MDDGTPAESLAVTCTTAPLHTAVFVAQAYATLWDRDRAVMWRRRYTPLDDLHFQFTAVAIPVDALDDEPRFRSLLMIPKRSDSRGC